MKTFVEDKLCPGQTRHNVNNLQIVKLLPIFLAWSQIVCTRLQNILITAEVTRGQVRTLKLPGCRDELPPVISPGDWPVTEPEPGDRGQVTIGAGESGSEPPVRGRGNHSVGDWRPGGVVAGTH